MDQKIIYEDKDILVIDKPAGINSDDFERRAHRLDKDTSGVLIIAKNDEALVFLQKQFEDRKTLKKYLALVVGRLRDKSGEIETLLGRSPGDRRKQKAYTPNDPNSEGKRIATTNYKVLEEFSDYDLIEVEPKTGRKHQIRAHMAYLSHPIAGDKLYGFKNQPKPEGLKRQFLHAEYLKITMPDGEEKEFRSDLPEDLKSVLEKLKNNK